MLLLVAIALVLIGVVTLVIGIFSDTLVWVFVSIGSTVLAGIVLYILYRLGRRQVAGTAADITRPVSTSAGEPSGPPAAAAVPSVPVPSSVPPAAVAEDDATVTVDRWAPDTVVVDEESLADDEESLAGDYEDFDDFPIAEYDELRVAEILPLLPELDGDELVEVRSREASGKARATILARIDDLAEVASVAGVATVPAATSVAVVDPAGDDFPIAEYDELRVAEILPLLRELDADELELVAEHEERTANRQTILNRVDALLDAIDQAALEMDRGWDTAPVEPPVPEPVAAVEPPAAERRAPAVRKAAATKAAAAKAPAKRAPAKKAATKAAPVKAAPATKAAPAKTTAPAKKAAPPAKKTASARKAAPATKAAPARKAAARKAAAPAPVPARSAAATRAPAKRVPAKVAPTKTTASRGSGRAAPATVAKKAGPARKAAPAGRAVKKAATATRATKKTARR